MLTVQSFSPSFPISATMAFHWLCSLMSQVSVGFSFLWAVFTSHSSSLIIILIYLEVFKLEGLPRWLRLVRLGCLISRVSDSVGQEWEPRICISNKFPGDTENYRASRFQSKLHKFLAYLSPIELNAACQPSYSFLICSQLCIYRGCYKSCSDSGFPFLLLSSPCEIRDH